MAKVGACPFIGGRAEVPRWGGKRTLSPSLRDGLIECSVRINANMFELLAVDLSVPNDTTGQTRGRRSRADLGSRPQSGRSGLWPCKLGYVDNNRDGKDGQGQYRVDECDRNGRRVGDLSGGVDQGHSAPKGRG